MTPVEPTPAVVKQCCADLYAGEWARLLIGDSFHPGGLALTERLGTLLNLGPDDRVLDVACGAGTSAIHLARTFGCHVTGVEYSPENVARARQSAREAGCELAVAFIQGDAERLELAPASFDVVICECALCTFPDKAAAVREFRRVLRPGGRAGISDVTLDGPLPAELDTLLTRVACIADTLPAHGYVSLLADAGFGDTQVERHGEAVQELIERVRVRLLGAQILSGIGKLPPSLAGADLRQALDLANLAAGVARAGRLGYALISARSTATG